MRAGPLPVCSPMTASAFPCPASVQEGLPLTGCLSQAPVPLASVGVWPTGGTGQGHEREGSKEKPSLCPAISQAVASLLTSSYTRNVPIVPASPGYPRPRAPGTPALPLSFWLGIVASCFCQFLGSSLPHLASQLSHPLCNQFPEFSSL